MLKSCKYCGRIHDTKYVCEQKDIAEKKRMSNRKATNALRFRRTTVWTNKSIDIRTRDKYMCLCCKAQLPGTVKQYNTSNLSVHHIVPIEEDYAKRQEKPTDGGKVLHGIGKDFLRRIAYKPADNKFTAEDTENSGKDSSTDAEKKSLFHTLRNTIIPAGT